MKTDKTYWFGPKRVGIGFGPRSWQGWAAIGLYALLMMVLPDVMGAQLDHRVRVASMVGLTVAFLIVFVWKLDTSKR
ncbi:hypothetical protein [Dyella telluris]|uniref:Uncharacterized protein n=1 Tax=Dyella telluris TaxID=2763498 RepID=A0A7G8Q5U3_9GAMM|nr:hypothetical protein [Dyella telluris]QNK02151.1 hypothetical protein H8F01_03005 [Dyella telluris]